MWWKRFTFLWSQRSVTSVTSVIWNASIANETKFNLKYDFWAFGVFSVDYTSAKITDPISYDSKDPTVLACLMYWTRSAMFVPNLHSIPCVNDPPAPLAPFSSTSLKHVAVWNPRAVKGDRMCPLISESLGSLSRLVNAEE